MVDEKIEIIIRKIRNKDGYVVLTDDRLAILYSIEEVLNLVEEKLIQERVRDINGNI